MEGIVQVVENIRTISMKIFNYENVDKMAAQSADQSEHSEDFGRV